MRDFLSLAHIGGCIVMDVSFFPDISSSDSDENYEQRKYVQPFPSIIFTSDNIERFKDQLFDDFVNDNFKNNLRGFVPFIPFKPINEEGVRCEKILNRNLEEDQNLLFNNLQRHHKEAFILDKRTGFETIQWHSVHSRLCKDPRMSHRNINKSIINKIDGECRKGNADNRLAFIFKNYYLVKQHFTFGEIHTSSDQVHLFVLYKVPLLIYISKHEKAFPEGTFNASRINSYVAYILKPKNDSDCTIFFVREKKSYLLLTLQKTAFRIFRLASDLFETFSKNPKLDETSEPVEIYDVEDESRRFFPMSEKDLIEKFGPKKRKNNFNIVPLDTVLWNPSAPSPPPRKMPKGITKSTLSNSSLPLEVSAATNLPYSSLNTPDQHYLSTHPTSSKSLQNFPNHLNIQTVDFEQMLYPIQNYNDS